MRYREFSAIFVLFLLCHAHSNAGVVCVRRFNYERNRTTIKSNLNANILIDMREWETIMVQLNFDAK